MIVPKSLGPPALPGGEKSGAYIALEVTPPPRSAFGTRWSCAAGGFGVADSVSDGVKRPSAEVLSKFSVAKTGLLLTDAEVGALNLTVVLPVLLVSSLFALISRACTM